ncbi:hypothetical protein KFE25_008470 [Diacronema lutheri]|uniref:Uncharacterized protein n=1 Tax=Diacronema lutheri TaxID=2081491 RepID=A0A8J5X3T6_DIALT|nr:hypothetical protein KFE25_008470 [Diacronema lutheri]
MSARLDGSSPGAVATRAILHAALCACDEPRLRALLGCLDTHWPRDKAISQSTHAFDPRANVHACTGVALRIADEFRRGEVSRAELMSAAAAYGDSIDAEAAAPLSLPLSGFAPAHAALAAYAGVLFLAVGVPVGLLGALLLDWTGAGIHRGMAQVILGLCADGGTVERGPIRGYDNKLLALQGAMAAANRATDGRAATEDGRWRTTAELERCVHHAIALHIPSSQAFADALPLEGGPFSTPRLRQPSAFPRVRLLGGGIRRHEFDISHVQRLRRFAHIVWAVAELRWSLSVSTGQGAGATAAGEVSVDCGDAPRPYV